MLVDGARLTQALTRGVERATTEHPLRSSIVSPITRENRQTSTGDGIPVMHVEFSNDIDYLDILMLPKGSGSESMSFLKMLFPSDGLAGVKKFIMECTVGAGGKPCPPTIVGIGIGGTSDLCVLLAKKATFRPVGERHPDPQIAALELELLEAINATGIGPMGLGGDTTALDVKIETAWTHITCNPVAVTMQCWRGERRREGALRLQRRRSRLRHGSRVLQRPVPGREVHRLSRQHRLLLRWLRRSADERSALRVV